MSKTAIITGAAGGLGKGIAERLANDGFNIVLQDINEALLLETEKNSRKRLSKLSHSRVMYLKEQEELVQFAVTEFGQLDVMVNNAGVDAVTPILEIGKRNYLSYLILTYLVHCLEFKQLLTNLLNKSKGKIINACSIAGHESYEVLGTYSATKHSVRSFTQTAAKELADKGITVNACAQELPKLKCGIVLMKKW